MEILQKSGEKSTPGLGITVVVHVILTEGGHSPLGSVFRSRQKV
jgi:hypothetical protein